MNNFVRRQWGDTSPLDLGRYERLVVWFSCGATSAIAAKIALDAARQVELATVVAYCETGSEHLDNERFLEDCEHWLSHAITRLRNPNYKDTWDVWERRSYISGVAGAPCTSELKKAPRERFERDGDLQVFGFDFSEVGRVTRFGKNQPEVAMWCPLVDTGIDKAESLSLLSRAGIALPAMYLLGYTNNNCIGCPKGNAGYWNKVRREFPDVFARMAALEERLGAKICQATVNGVRKRVSLSELPVDAGRYGKQASIECGLLCDPISDS